MPPGLRWASVSAGYHHSCGIEQASRRLHCWGSDRSKQVSGWKKLVPTTRWASVSAGVRHSCAIEQASRRLHCWGDDRHKLVSGWKKLVAKPETTRWASVSAGRFHSCGIIEGSHKPICWGKNGLYNQREVPTKGVRWEPPERSCRIQHPTLNGPASCTMCHKGCHHTITDPKRNAGTCTKKECPMCKPKSCCGKHHKHYVYNTESMEGVCVRHNDDCTAVCMPRTGLG